MEKSKRTTADIVLMPLIKVSTAHLSTLEERGAQGSRDLVRVTQSKCQSQGVNSGRLTAAMPSVVTLPHGGVASSGL